MQVKLNTFPGFGWGGVVGDETTLLCSSLLIGICTSLVPVLVCGWIKVLPFKYKKKLQFICICIAI